MLEAYKKHVFPIIRSRFRNEQERALGLEQLLGAITNGECPFCFSFLFFLILYRCHHTQMYLITLLYPEVLSCQVKSGVITLGHAFDILVWCSKSPILLLSLCRHVRRSSDDY